MEVKVVKLYNPFPVGPTNIYIINREIVLDSGINLPESVQKLENSLKELDLDFDTAKLVISHPHADHFGSAYLFKKAFAHRNACKKLHDAERSYLELVYIHFQREGLPYRLALRMMENYERVYKGLVIASDSCSAIGGTLKANGDVLKVIHVPGHSYGHIALYHKETSTIFSGDVMLNGITPNPMIEPIDEERRMPVIEQYLETLENLYKLEISRAYPGHRDVVFDYRKIIRNHLKEYEKRSLLIFENAHKKNAFEVATSLFADLKQLFLIMTETIAQLDFLEKRGFVEKRDGRYHVTGEKSELVEMWTRIKEKIVSKG